MGPISHIWIHKKDFWLRLQVHERDWKSTNWHSWTDRNNWTMNCTTLGTSRAQCPSLRFVVSRLRLSWITKSTPFNLVVGSTSAPSRLPPGILLFLSSVSQSSAFLVWSLALLTLSVYWSSGRYLDRIQRLITRFRLLLRSPVYRLLPNLFPCLSLLSVCPVGLIWFSG